MDGKRRKKHRRSRTTSRSNWRRWPCDFGRQQVLRDIDLAIARGQTLAVIGESGCGKTVLLKTIIGLLQPTRGAVRVRRPQPGRAERPGIDPPADPLRLPLPAGGPVRQHDDRPERGFSLAAAHAQDRRPRSAQIVTARLAEVGPAGETSWSRSRPSFPAACGSGSAWPAPWPWSRRSCSTTSRPPAWTRS